MLIGIDAGCLGIRDERLKVGVYNVAKNLLIHLGKIDTENTYYLYSFHPIEKGLMKQFSANMHNIVVKPSKGWMKIWLPLRISRDKIDTFLAFGQAIPKLPKSVKKIGYIYDIAFEKYPQFYPDSYKQLHNITANLVKKSDHIITISQAAKKDIHDYYSIPESRISAILLGNRLLETSDSTKSEEKYFLSVGALKRIKNIAAVIKAFAAFSTKKSDYNLVIVGGDKWMDPDITEAYEKLPEEIKKHVSFRGFVSDEELNDLYKNAQALIVPSYYEGFGLPVAEAMSVGCPVIVSNRGSLPEIVGDAGYITNPDDIVTIANYMIKLTQSRSERILLGEKGQRRVKSFTWEKCANETLSVINKV